MSKTRVPLILVCSFKHSIHFPPYKRSNYKRVTQAKGLNEPCRMKYSTKKEKKNEKNKKEKRKEKPYPFSRSSYEMKRQAPSPFPSPSSTLALSLVPRDAGQKINNEHREKGFAKG